MLDFLTRQFRYYIKYRNIGDEGIKQLIETIQSNIHVNGIIQINPHTNDDVIQWNINVSRNNKLKFQINYVKFQNISFSQFLMHYVCEYKMLIIMFSNCTSEKINNKVVKELWGFRLFLTTNLVVLKAISLDELFQSCTMDLNGATIPAQENIIYCGPEGKRFGWEEI